MTLAPLQPACIRVKDDIAADAARGDEISGSIGYRIADLRARKVIRPMRLHDDRGRSGDRS